MTEDLKTLNPPEDLIEWVWAYRQALTLLDQFDAEGLDCAARHETWPEASWYRFLDVYRLKRGGNAKLRNRREDVFGQLIPIFKPTLGEAGVGRSEQLQQRWQEGVDRMGRLCAKKRQNGDDLTLWSLVSKLLWFYQPEFMTMYDTYAHSGLAKIHRGINPKRNYLQYFEQLFENKRFDIDRAAKFSDRVYPYPRRVLDQWLWLRGRADRGKYLRTAFKLSLERARISRRESNWAAQPGGQDGEAAVSSLKDEIVAIGQRCAALPDRDLRSADEILGYDRHGLPH